MIKVYHKAKYYLDCLLVDRIRLGDVRKKDFSIISNNCWGAEIYKELKMPYLTPFIGLFVFPSDYLLLLSDLQRYMAQDLRFIDSSKFEQANIKRASKPYPIGLLSDSIEVHFEHYKNQTEAVEKWTRRKERINWDRLFIKLDDRDGFTELDLRAFDLLPYKHKVTFTSNVYKNSQSAVCISECQSQDTVMNGKRLYGFSKRHFDIARWLNGEQY
jgi:uncharacterized protein (DUF1919 family)